MLTRITIAVPDSVADRLDRLAAAEFRDRKQQAAALLVEAIDRREVPTTVHPAEHAALAPDARRR